MLLLLFLIMMIYQSNNCLAKTKHKALLLHSLNRIPSVHSSFDTIRLTIAFFSISGLDILDCLSEISDSRKQDICNWIYKLQVLPKDGVSTNQCGFQGSTSLMFTENGISKVIDYYCNSHLAMSYTGIATLVILGDDLKRVDRAACLRGVRALQKEDGSFSATLGGSESDMRFVYCAACVCYMLSDWSGMDVDKAVSYIRNSISYDGGIGQGPELESHGGSTYCAVAALTLMGRLDTAFTNKQLSNLKRWSIMRQVDGFQGRPNKPQDTCYSFWVGASLKLLNILEMVGFKENRAFLMSTQKSTSGGFSKTTDMHADVMHTYLGLSGLSLMQETGLLEIDPALNITQRAKNYLLKLQEDIITM